MAVVTLFSPFAFTEPQDWDWFVDDYSSTSLTISDGIHKQVFKGSFNYPGEDLVTGTATSSSYYLNNVLVYTITGMSKSAATLADFASTFGDTQQTYAYVLDGNDTINGSSGDDVLLGYAGNDTINGGAGDDHLEGGLGNDTYIIDAGDTIFEDEDEGIDLVKAAHTYRLGQNLENLTLLGSSDIDGKGNGLNNVITGNDGNNKLDGVGGVDTLIGGKGNDKYIVDLTENNALEDKVVELAGGGIDTLVLYSEYENNQVTTIKLDANLEHLDGSDTGSLSLNLTGNAASNKLTGNNGANTLDGGAGIDTLIGGLGDDTYIIDNLGDIIEEDVGGGTDTVKVAIATAGGTYTLGNNLENATLINTVAFNLNGNELNNILTGNAAANRIDGGAGADTMSGGAGNDTYVVDDEGDVITDAAGIDTVETDLTYSLVTRLDLENIKLTGSETSSAIGNDKANTLTGNVSSNMLDGGLGVDTLIGGAGDDFYFVDLTATNALQDTIVERADEGRDMVFLRGGSSTAKATTLTLGANLDNLDASQTGSAKLNLTGNALDNVLVGNDWDNLLNGGAGADVLIGGLGKDTLDGGLGADTLIGGADDDTYVVDHADDIVTEGFNEGSDTVRVAIAAAGGTYALGTNLENAILTNSVAFNLIGNSFANTLTGNAAANRIDGGAGADIMNGGAGNDTYVVDNVGDEITDSAGIDTVETHLDYSLALRPTLENITLTGNQNVSATGNAQANVLDGSQNSAANVLTGGKGNDTYIVGAGDTAVEVLPGDGVDLVKSYVDYTLGANLENLTLIGPDAIDGTGNQLNNIILGNSASNTLYGGLGVDTLKGGDGNDTYIVDLTAKNLLEDTITENATEGLDLVVLQGGNSSAGVNTLTLGANLENLDASQTGSAKLNLTGNALDNVLVGNDWDNLLNGGAGADVLIGGLGKDTLDGGLGADTLIGGADDDTYVVDHAGDIVTEGFNEGSDTVRVAIAAAGGTYALGTNLENAILTNSVAFNLIGNSLANTLTGNAAANRIDGGAGADIMNGGAGNDTYVVDNVGDEITDSAGIDTVETDLEYSLAFRSTLENITLTGNQNVSATGNALANVLDGSQNSAANVLTGGKGNDTYIVGAGDTAVEVLPGDGVDLVKSYVDYTLGANLENLTLIGPDAIDGTGNQLNNIILGNSASNTLYGGLGVDTLKGGDGNDTYIVDLTAKNLLEDTITENATEGKDTVRLQGGAVLATYTTLTLGANLEVMDASLTGSTKLNLTGNALNNELVGNDANNTLDGGLGDDLLDGGKGNDTLLGGAGNDSLYGGEGDDTLNGGAGMDFLLGGLGNDTYVVDSFSDNVIEEEDEGTDQVNVAIATAGGTYLLGTHLENATLTNTVAFNLTGNELDNVLTGNSAANIIDGGAGADLMIGGAGNDTYYVDDENDVIQDSSGIDTIISSVSYSMTVQSGVENLRLTGTADLYAEGNKLANLIYGNSGNNFIDGFGGADTLYGGEGDDLYLVDLTSSNALEDKVIELTGEGIDTLVLNGGKAGIKATTITLMSNVENLDASETTSGVNLNLVGNALDNVLIGNTGKNIFTGGLGSDTFVFYDLNQLSKDVGTMDVITDFKSGTDHIDLSGLGFDFQLIDSNAAFTGAGQLKFTGGVLYGSTNEDGAADFAIQLTGVTGLTMNDFIQAT